jgi:4-hydroxybenzoate polyprenyltransferase
LVCFAYYSVSIAFNPSFFGQALVALMQSKGYSTGNIYDREIDADRDKSRQAKSPRNSSSTRQSATDMNACGANYAYANRIYFHAGQRADSLEFGGRR